MNEESHSTRTSRRSLTGPEFRRYSRHLLLPEFGETGQRALLSAKVAVIGAGGLGSPILQYLAAAGVGEITVIDPDSVEESNLQRQVIHTEAAVGHPKVASAARAVHALNSAVQIHAYHGVLTPDNALELLGGHDLVLDGTDNFPTRYLASDACEILNIPLVWGSILAFHGQVSVFWDNKGHGVTYRDVHPEPPKPGEVPSCSDAGVLGMLVGIIGSAMAMEAVKVLTGVGTPLYGRIKLYDALTADWSTIEVERTPGRPTVTTIENLVDTCGFPAVPGETATVVELNSADMLNDAASPERGNAPESHEPEVLSPHEARAHVSEGRRLIDIREPHEIAAGMLPGAVHVPRTQLIAIARAEHEGVGEITSASDIEGAIIHCQGGIRSAVAQTELAELGVHVADLAGGYAAAAVAQE